MSRIIGIGFVLGVLCASCGGGSGAKRYELSDGTRVEVDAEGGVRLFAPDGRALAGLAPRAPTLRRFTPDVRMLQGFFTFRRRELEERPLDRFEGSVLEDGRVVLRFSSEEGASGALSIGVDT